MSVVDWPAYLIRSIPPDTRAALTARADHDNVSLADVVRQALCARYGMECEQASYGYQPDLDNNGDALLVRLQPEVFDLMKRETHGRYGATKHLVFDALDNYLKGTQE